jgi:phospholipase C
MALENIEHIVVVMMENRSFDNLLGWLYADQNNRPPLNIPAQMPPSFDGLTAGAFSNQSGSTTVYASRPPTAWPPANNPNVVPSPDPHEEFAYVNTQLFGTATPAAGATPDMSGFLKDYTAAVPGGAGAAQIMQTYGPTDANVINALARQFAVCDRWFASVPTQTWPNRGFVHTGSSDGHINNDDYEPYDIPTIFNVLESQGKSWGIFHDTTLIPSLTLSQFFPRLLPLAAKVQRYQTFKNLCVAPATAAPAEKLPNYSFIEPRFTPELGLFAIDYPSDYHPPHNVCRGEQFLADVYQAVRSSPYRDSILLLITFDEHGGCYDHVPPPTGAAAPLPGNISRDSAFDFSRFGVRVPAIVVSSYVSAGTVFRAPPNHAPFDHTSILATLRDWLGLANDSHNPFLASPRITNAPTLEGVLTLDNTTKTLDWPSITATCTVGADDQSLQTPLSSLQHSLIASAHRQDTATPNDPITVKKSAAEAKSLKTYEDALNYLHPDAPRL